MRCLTVDDRIKRNREHGMRALKRYTAGSADPFGLRRRDDAIARLARIRSRW
jgi:hypothetical protein